MIIFTQYIDGTYEWCQCWDSREQYIKHYTPSALELHYNSNADTLDDKILFAGELFWEEDIACCDIFIGDYLSKDGMAFNDIAVGELQETR